MSEENPFIGTRDGDICQDAGGEIADNRPSHPPRLESDAVDALPELIAEIKHLRGAMKAQDERERLAGSKCGVDVIYSGCDWPDAVSDEVVWQRAEIERLTKENQALRKEPKK